MTTNSWILPDGINEILAPNGWRIELLRRTILDRYQSWGYELVIPPIVEHLDSLLTGTGRELDLQTFKLTDLVSGRLIGLRADITPQIARIDASQNHSIPARYCYVGTVLHTRAFDFNGVRDPLQIGVELFGHKGIESDLEVINLMLETLTMANVNNITLDLGHVGIIKALLSSENLTQTATEQLFNAITRKSAQEIATICDENNIAAKDILLALTECNGDKESIQKSLSSIRLNKVCSAKVEHLLALGEQLEKHFKTINIVYDLAELKGYQYHTGVVFSAYVNGMGKEIARGGRYDEIGKEFGEYRPATGFSSDLKILFESSNAATTQGKVIAPNQEDSKLAQFIQQLREKNVPVIQSFEADLKPADYPDCSHTIQLINNQWQLVEAAHGE